VKRGEAVAAYHQEQLAALVAHVGSAVDDYRAGKLDPFEVDRVIFQYSRAAKELWKFCSFGDPEFVAGPISRDEAPVDWWDQAAPRERGR